MAINNDLARIHVQKNLNSYSSINRIENSRNPEEQKLKEAADGFEELFTHKLFQVMRAGSEKDGLLSGGRGEEIFQDMLDENYSKIITKSGALGLSKMIFENAKESLKKS